MSSRQVHVLVIQLHILLSLVMRNPVFRVCDQVRLKLACSATETSTSLEILDLESLGIILSRQWTTKMLIRLRGCAGWSAPVLRIWKKTGFLMMWLYLKAFLHFKIRLGLRKPWYFDSLSDLFRYRCLQYWQGLGDAIHYFLCWIRVVHTPNHCLSDLTPLRGQLP